MNSKVYKKYPDLEVRVYKKYPDLEVREQQSIQEVS